MIPKLNGREKVQAHIIANKVNEIIEIMTKLNLEIEELKNQIVRGSKNGIQTKKENT